MWHAAAAKSVTETYWQKSENLNKWNETLFTRSQGFHSISHEWTFFNCHRRWPIFVVVYKIKLGIERLQASTR